MADDLQSENAVSNVVATKAVAVDETRQLVLDNGISYIEYVTGPATSTKLAVTFVNYGLNDRLARGFGEQVLRKLGYDVLAVKAGRNNWFQDLSLETMAELCATLPAYEDVITYGSSMGGYGAIYFADAVGASKSIAISPQLSIDPAVPPFEQRWRNDAAHIAFSHRPMVEILRSTAAHHHVIYDPTIYDARHVDIMTGATDKIRPLRVPFSGHPSGFFLAETGALLPILRSILEGHSVPVRSLIRSGRRRSPSYFAGLATRARELGHYDLATSAFEKTIALGERVDVLMAYSQFLLSQHNPARALTIFERAERLYAPHAHYLAFKAHLLEVTGDETRALATFDKAITMEPDFAPFYVAERRLLREKLIRLERTSEMLDAALKKTRAQREHEEGGAARPRLTPLMVLRYLLISITMVLVVIAIARYAGLI